ncbi:unnamed protein product, partial [Cylicocyclus nassatus]
MQVAPLYKSLYPSPMSRDFAPLHVVSCMQATSTAVSSEDLLTHENERCTIDTQGPAQIVWKQPGLVHGTESKEDIVFAGSGAEQPENV